MNFGKYRLNVRYRMANGRYTENSVEKATYGIPSVGDHIGLLIDREWGTIQSNPFPELWLGLAVAYAFLGGIIYMFVKVSWSVIRR